MNKSVMGMIYIFLKDVLFLKIRWDYLFDPKLAIESLPFLLEGLKTTVFMAGVSLIFTIIIGLIVALVRYSNVLILSQICKLYVSLMRGVPVLVFVFILYYGLPVIGVEFKKPVTAAIVAISLNSGAYMSEVMRSSLLSVPKEQWEAATVLGMNYFQTVSRIILPQAVRIAIPPGFSVFIDVVKSTSLASTVTVQDMFYNARIIAGRTFDSMTMYICVALFYWVICIILTNVQGNLEKEFNKYISKNK